MSGYCLSGIISDAESSFYGQNIQKKYIYVGEIMSCSGKFSVIEISRHLSLTYLLYLH